MRAVIVSPSLRMGGAERVAKQQAEQLAQTWEAALLTLEGPSVDFFDAPTGVRRLHCDGATSRFNTFKALRRETGEADVVIAHVDHVALWVLAAWFGRRGAPPIVVVEHQDPRRSPTGWSRRLARRVLYRTASAVVVLTDSAARWFSDHYGIDTYVIPNAVARGAEGRRVNPSIDLLFVGRLAPEKGSDLLCDVLSSPELIARDLRTVVAGDGPAADDMKSEAMRRGLRIEFAGAVKDVERLYRTSRILTAPSRVEGHPLVLLEAMSAGCVPVAFDVETGPREIISHGSDGVLVRSGAVDEFAAVVAALIDEPARLAKMSKNASRAAARFGTSMQEERWDDLFSSIGVGRTSSMEEAP
ncbi:MAG: glycosyltransferase [Acidimicrobiales bacterium]